MNTLSPDQKDIILNFYFRCGTEDEILRGRDLIASDSRAAEMYSKLEESLQQLDHVKYEPCPDNLADLTIARLKQAAEMKQQNRLGELLEAEQFKTPTLKIGRRDNGFWRNFGEVAAIAATIIMAFAIGFPTLSNARQRAWQQQCAAGLANVGAGLARYANDHFGALPEVKTQSGQPWWKVGYDGQDNQSNTRHYWLLVKNGYAESKNFICPARKDARELRAGAAEIARMCDFPSRDHVSYSFMLMCDPLKTRQRMGKVTILMADMNPVFESVFSRNQPAAMTQDKFDKISLNDQMLSMMSRNHRGRGQTVLLTGGSADFKQNRVLLDDDIYTMKNTSAYFGTERPCDENDFFLVP